MTAFASSVAVTASDVRLSRAAVAMAATPGHSLGFIEPCLPMISRTVPTGAGWAYKIKHDGFASSAGNLFILWAGRSRANQ
jgi:hypothetical protein